MSPACMREDTGFPRACLWGHAQEGCQGHMLWTCDQRSKQLQKPEDPLQAWLGWPTGKAGEDKNDEEVLAWLEEVAHETWRRMYDARGERPEQMEVEEEAKEEE